jgi:hypothetical protein
MMDVSMAVALGTALYLHRAKDGRWNLPLLGGVAALQSVMLVLSFLGLFASRPSLPDLMASRDATRQDVALLARQRDPVICESLALCYWAGRARALDAFGFSQQVRRGVRPASDLTRLLDAHAFRMIQLQPRSLLAPPSPFWGAIGRNYYMEHQDKNGQFLIPRDQRLTGGASVFGR